MAEDDIARRWNHNLRYHRLILAALPQHVDSAIDAAPTVIQGSTSFMATS